MGCGGVGWGAVGWAAVGWGAVTSFGGGCDLIVILIIGATSGYI